MALGEAQKQSLEKICSKNHSYYDPSKSKGRDSQMYNNRVSSFRDSQLKRSGFSESSLGDTEQTGNLRNSEFNKKDVDSSNYMKSKIQDSRDAFMCNQFKNMRNSKLAVTASSSQQINKALDVIDKNGLYKIKNYFIKTGTVE